MNVADDNKVDVAFHTRWDTPGVVYGASRSGAPEELLTVLDGLGLERHSTGQGMFVWHQVPQGQTEEETRRLVSTATATLLTARYTITAPPELHDQVVFDAAMNAGRPGTVPSPAARCGGTRTPGTAGGGTRVKVSRVALPEPTPTGAAILAANRRGVLRGHPASLAKLVGDGWAVARADGEKVMSEAGTAAWAAREAGEYIEQPAIERLVIAAGDHTLTGRRSARHRAVLRAAEALAADDPGAQVMLLVNDHGLVRPGQPLPERRPGKNNGGLRSPAFLRRQIEELAIDDAAVIVLGSTTTVQVLRQVRPNLVAPLHAAVLDEERGLLDRIAQDDAHRAELWAETARQMNRGVDEEPCPGCRLRHGRVRVCDLLPGDAIEAGEHTVLVKATPRSPRVRVAGGPPGAPRSVPLDAYQVLDVRRPLTPFRPWHHSEALGRSVESIPPHSCDCACESCWINRHATTGPATATAASDR